jgi:release factor glutamine methyltransferase
MPELESLEGRLTLAAARRWAIAALRAAGVDDAGSDVRRLLAAALGWSPAQILARPEFALLPEQAEAFVGFVERRRRREPVSRILGCREFYGRSFAVSAATLDPRPASETLIEAALLLTLLCELPQATGLGTDLSAAALTVARGNAAALGVQDRAAWRISDLLENVDGPFHMVLSNPPYLRSAEIATLEPEVSRFDPRLALDGGADGLEIFRRLSAGVPGVVGDGWIVLEVGHDQADQVAELLRWARPAGCRINVKFYTDVSGQRRCVAARTRN